MQKQVNESSAHTRLDDRLDFVVGSVREVRNSPAGVNENLVVERIDELRENCESRRDLKYNLSTPFLL